MGQVLSELTSNILDFRTLISQENHGKCPRKDSEETLVRQRNRLDRRHCSPFDKRSIFFWCHCCCFGNLNKQTNICLTTFRSRCFLFRCSTYIFICVRSYFSEHIRCGFYVVFSSSFQNTTCVPFMFSQTALTNPRINIFTVFLLASPSCQGIAIIPKHFS